MYDPSCAVCGYRLANHAAGKCPAGTGQFVALAVLQRHKRELEAICGELLSNQNAARRSATIKRAKQVLSETRMY